MPSLYDHIGEGYDTTRQADPYITSRLAQHLGIRGDARYLDVACGTGNYTIALAQGRGWVGIDRSTRMLTRARQKTDAVTWICADVEDLPFDANEFCGAVCVLAAHHFESRIRAFKEIARVISERFVIFTSTREQMAHYWLAEYFPDAMKKSISQMPTRTEFVSAIVAAGLTVQVIEEYVIRDDLRDMFLYSGKHRPSIYLDERVRRGISTFASFAAASEVNIGLKKLQADINSGRIDRIRRAYESVEGDYSFVIAST